MAINRTLNTIMKFIYNAISQDNVSLLMDIELACHPHPWTEKTFRSCIGGRYFGQYLSVDNQIIGFYVGEHIAGEATLMDICVHPSEQGKGYGKELLLHFITQCETLENSSIFLEVRAKNISAQMLYINYGFCEISRRTGYYPSNTGFGYEDAIVMKKSL